MNNLSERLLEILMSKASDIAFLNLLVELNEPVVSSYLVKEYDSFKIIGYTLPSLGFTLTAINSTFFAAQFHLALSKFWGIETSAYRAPLPFGIGTTYLRSKIRETLNPFTCEARSSRNAGRFSMDCYRIDQFDVVVWYLKSGTELYAITVTVNGTEFVQDEECFS